VVERKSLFQRPVIKGGWVNDCDAGSQRIALVTGASRGIGRAVALELACKKIHVVALARTQGALEELDDEINSLGGSATLVPVDLKDNEALDRLAAALLERWGRLDILVGNAGILGELAPLTHLDPPVWDAVMAVNVTANWRLIRAMDPLLRASAAGRAVFITSSVARSAKAYWGAYAVSKAALETMARIYAAETQSSAVKVMLANPGPLRTAMRRAAMPGEDPLTLKTPQDFAPALIALTAPEWIESGRLYDFSTDKVVEF
jgi:NAD(P)-dependent dehydrogenase (short-subunit alcohol dehydrogenase family)